MKAVLKKNIVFLHLKIDYFKTVLTHLSSLFSTLSLTIDFELCCAGNTSSSVASSASVAAFVSVSYRLNHQYAGSCPEVLGLYPKIRANVHTMKTPADLQGLVPFSDSAHGLGK